MLLAWRQETPRALILQLNDLCVAEVLSNDGDVNASRPGMLAWVAQQARQILCADAAPSSPAGTYPPPSALMPPVEGRHVVCSAIWNGQKEIVAALMVWPSQALRSAAEGAPWGASQVADDVLESMSDAFFAVDRKWTVLRVNAHHVALSQIRREDQLGKNFLDLFLFSPEAKKSKYWINYHKCMRERAAVCFEEYYPSLDIWTKVRAYPTADGGIAVFFSDVTEQKKSYSRIEFEKKKFEAIFLDSPAPMALLRGPDLIFEKINQKYQALMGARQLLGKNLVDALPELIGQPFPQLMGQVLDSGRAYAASETLVRLVRREGGHLEDTYFDFSYSRIEDGENRPYGVYPRH